VGILSQNFIQFNHFLGRYTMDVPVVLAIAGVVALIIGFLGGGIRAKEIEIPSIPTPARVIVSIGGIAFIALAIWLSSPSTFTPSEPTALPVAAATASNTVMPSITETETSAPPEAQETPVATLDLPDSSNTFVEDFTKGSLYWETGMYEGDRATVSRSVANGAFRWQVTPKVAVSTGIGSKLPIVSDFDLEVTLKKVDGPDSVEYGVVFRKNDAGGYYFMIAPSGQYALSKWSEEAQEWIDLIDWTQSTHINLNGENKLRVYAVGSKIRLYINENLVADYVDQSFAAGTIDTGVWLGAGENLTLDMTSFKIVLLSP
jgi:hypothetical protein